MKIIKIEKLIKSLEDMKQSAPTVKTIELNSSYKLGWNGALNKLIQELKEISKD